MESIPVRLDYELIVVPKDDICKRCGKCCYYYSKIDKCVKKCKHLIWFQSSGKSFCRIYNKRNSKLRSGKAYQLEKDCICVLRKFGQYDYPNCPLNTGKPFPPWFDEMQELRG